MEDLYELIRLLKAEDLTEITVWEGDRRITVRRAPSAAPTGGKSPAEETAEETREEEGTFVLTAPLVGTFYLRPSPDDPPFVEEGATVAPGDTLGIIEAMKVLNEIKAERAGKLRRILVSEGAPVEYGQPLFLFEEV